MGPAGTGNPIYPIYLKVQKRLSADPMHRQLRFVDDVSKTRHFWACHDSLGGVVRPPTQTQEKLHFLTQFSMGNSSNVFCGNTDKTAEMRRPCHVSYTDTRNTTFQEENTFNAMAQ